MKSGKYFKGLKKAFADKGFADKPLIFIDASLKNVQIATQKGFIGILFITAEQTENDLKSLGIELDV